MRTNEITDREMEVLRLMAQDKKPEEIAKIVHVTTQAVKMRIWNMKQRFGIRTQACLLVKLAKTFIL